MNMPNNYSPMGGGGFSMDMPGGPGAPDMKGTWISKRTGAEVQVRDAIITENGMSVMLSDGRMIDMAEFSNEFYQMSDDVYDMNGNKIGNAPVNIPDYHPESPMPKPGCDCPPIDVPGNEIDPGFAYPPKPDHHPCPKPGPKPPCPIPPLNPNPDMDTLMEEKKHLSMITDVFDKVEPTPNLECIAKITNASVATFPTKQIQMIIDIFGVHIDDVTLYLYQRYFTPEKIMGYLRTYLTTDTNGPKLTEPKESDDTTDTPSTDNDND